MMKAEIDGYVIEYGIETSGQDQGIKYNSLRQGQETDIRPVNPIKTTVVGKIKADRNASRLKIGFVQTVTKSYKFVEYGDKYFGKETYGNSPPPLIDLSPRGQAPWYADDRGLFERDEWKAPVVPFILRASDQPGFKFVSEFKGNRATVAEVEMHFILCLMVQINNVNYFVYEVGWTYDGKWYGEHPEKPNEAYAGIQVKHAKEIRFPHKQPDQVKTLGPSADEMGRMTYK